MGQTAKFVKNAETFLPTRVELGTGGLVRAYTTATARALENAEVVTVRSVVELRMTVDYSLYERASLLIDAAGAKQAAPEFAEFGPDLFNFLGHVWFLLH